MKTKKKGDGIKIGGRRQRGEKILKLVLMVLPKVEGVCGWGETRLVYR